MPELIPQPLHNITGRLGFADQAATAIKYGRLPFGAALPAFGLKQSSLFSRSGIADAGEMKGRRERLAGGRPSISGSPSVTNAIQTNQTKQTQFTSTGPNNPSGSALST